MQNTAASAGIERLIVGELNQARQDAAEAMKNEFGAGAELLVSSDSARPAAMVHWIFSSCSSNIPFEIRKNIAAKLRDFFVWEFIYHSLSDLSAVTEDAVINALQGEPDRQETSQVLNSFYFKCRYLTALGTQLQQFDQMKSKTSGRAPRARRRVRVVAGVDAGVGAAVDADDDDICNIAIDSVLVGFASSRFGDGPVAAVASQPSSSGDCPVATMKAQLARGTFIQSNVNQWCTSESDNSQARQSVPGNLQIFSTNSPLGLGSLVRACDAQPAGHIDGLLDNAFKELDDYLTAFISHDGEGKANAREQLRHRQGPLREKAAVYKLEIENKLGWRSYRKRHIEIDAWIRNDSQPTEKSKDESRDYLQKRALLVSIVLNVETLLEFLENTTDEIFSTAVYGALSLHASIYGVSDDVYQEVVQLALTGEPKMVFCHAVKWYSAFFELLGLALRGAVFKGDDSWAAVAGGLEDRSQSLLDGAIHRIISTAGWWLRGKLHQDQDKHYKLDLLMQAFVALGNIFERAASLGVHHNGIIDLTWCFRQEYPACVSGMCALESLECLESFRRHEL